MNKNDKINELRNKWHSFDSHTKEFEKALKQECENEGIDFYLVQCTEQQLNTVKIKGNISNF